MDSLEDSGLESCPPDEAEVVVEHKKVRIEIESVFDSVQDSGLESVNPETDARSPIIDNILEPNFALPLEINNSKSPIIEEALYRPVVETGLITVADSDFDSEIVPLLPKNSELGISRLEGPSAPQINLDIRNPIDNSFSEQVLQNINRVLNNLENLAREVPNKSEISIQPKVEVFVPNVDLPKKLEVLEIDLLIANKVLYKEARYAGPVNYVESKAGQMTIVEVTDQEVIYLNAKFGPINVWLDASDGSSLSEKITLKDVSNLSRRADNDQTYPIKIFSRYNLERYDYQGKLIYDQSQDQGGYCINTVGGCITYRRIIIDLAAVWVIESEFIGNPR